MSRVKSSSLAPKPKEPAQSEPTQAGLGVIEIGHWWKDGGNVFNLFQPSGVVGL